MQSPVLAAIVGLALAVPTHGQQDTEADRLQAEADRLQADIMAEWASLDIGSWSALVKRDAFTDEITAFMARIDGGPLLICDSYGDDGSNELRLHLGNFAPLNVESIGVTYRIGSEPPQTGIWLANTGTTGSSVTVPAEILECVLRAGQLAIRVQDSTRRFVWDGGGAVYELGRRCAA